MVQQIAEPEQNNVAPLSREGYTIERSLVGYDGVGGTRGARMHVFYHVKLEGRIVASRKRRQAAERYVARKQQPRKGVL